MFIGKFRNDTAESFGRYIHKENDVYEGEFTQNVASGYGIYLHSNGNSYEGQWLNDTQKHKNKKKLYFLNVYTIE